MLVMKNSKNTIETNLDNVLMPVELVKTSDLLFNPMLEVPSKMENAVIRNSKIYGFVSDNFGLVQPSNVHNVFSEKLKQFGLNNVSGKFDAKGNFHLKYTIENEYKKGSKEFNEALRNKDIINPSLLISGGIAGTHILSAKGQGNRPVCENGSSIASILFSFASKNTKNNHSNKVGINSDLDLNFDLILPEIEKFIKDFEQVKEIQKTLIDMELNKSEVLPMFYELTKGTLFPQTKFQDAFDVLKNEKSILGYTKVNRYLAYNALNYILEHDKMSMDLVKRSEIDSVLASRVIDLDINNAVRNFNEIYSEHNNKKNSRKILELV
jgi:hypothetical protein